jgi:alkanesulfonate monooxygenase SsuD/methylene tetrahydromethanopterin reductase-like flavin-dependent oxidoreductase (luciferase family)
MRFGWLTRSHSPSADGDHAAIEEQLAQAGHAEDVGFDSVWLTEHNFAVVQLALRHPVRLAVQLALLDNLSRGRLDVGVGRGTLYNEYEYVGYGLRSDDSRERSAEALEMLTRAWTEEPFGFRGKFFQTSFPALRPRVYQRPHPPIWRSVVTAASFEECGRQGVPILTSRIPLAVIPERLRLY